MMGGEPLCPNPDFWQLGLMESRSDRVILHLVPIRESVACPTCGARSSRVHSRYLRRPWDLPWSSWPTQLVVRARKFFCDAAQCPRRTFTERFPGILQPFARRTERLRRALLELAHASNAVMAARVAKLLGLPASGDTLIRQQRQETFTFPTPGVLGVDEFALRRSFTYGTILIDLERQRPVDILYGRQAEPLAQWLEAHPGVNILVRDRAEAYALGGRTGSPKALQIADRFHLAHNVSEALKELSRSRRWHFALQAARATAAGPMQKAPPTPVPEMRGPKPTPRKQALWEAVQQRKDLGQSYSDMARELGVNRKTIRQYLTRDHPPTYGPQPPRRTRLTPHLPYLHQRWREGCHNARRLYRELVERGYQGSETQVKETVRPWRSPQPSGAWKTRRTTGTIQRLLLRPYDELGASDRKALEEFLAANPALARGHRLKEGFRGVLVGRDVEAFDTWLQDADRSGLGPFEALAQSFRQDYEAVRLALLTPWSTAQCEGQVCRVKLIKRLGYGRAKLDLLRQRVLHRSAA